LIYLKSTLLGLVAFVVAILLYAVAGLTYIISRVPRPPPNSDVSIPGGHVALALWPALLVGVIAFAAAFYWMFRRSSRARS
jgi:hypothetical protein